MRKSSARSVGAIVGLGLILAACSGSKQTPPNGFTGSAGEAGSSGIESVCAPDTRRCEGLQVKACDSIGARELVVETCLPSQSCSNGACVGSACIPNTAFCKDGAVWKCDNSGTSTLSERCAPGLFCRAEADSASCSTQACASSQPVCDGDVATTCRSDGTGPTSGGVDCSNAKQVCYGGQCRDVACSNGSKICEHGDVYLCARNGTELSLLSDCRVGEVCDADTGTCRAQLCEAGKVGCDGTRVQTCNGFGSAWLPGTVDCAADGKICVSGSCRKQICGANRSFCQDGSVFLCDSSGTTATVTQTCNDRTEHCATYSSSFAHCQANDCQAGDSLCADNMIKVCNADGSLPLNGTPCGAAQYCENAQCKDLQCEPGAYFCKGSDVHFCDFSGPYLSQQCEAETTCKTSGTSGAVCAPFACSPSSSACLGNQIGTCAADGQGLSQVSTDCATTTSVCTLDLKCAKTVTDTLGVSEGVEPFPSGFVIGDVVEVTSARKLSELQTQLVLAGPRELRWIVYELSGQTFVPKIDKVVSSVTGTGFISSGPFSYKLSAGKRYLLAVVVSGGDAIGYVDTQPFPANVSFGTVSGRVLAFYPGSFDVFGIDPSYVTQMKVITEAP